MRTRKSLELMTVNDELLLPIMETIAQRTQSRSLLEALQAFSVCVIIQYKIRASLNTTVILF